MELFAAFAEHPVASYRRMGTRALWRRRRPGRTAARGTGKHSVASQAQSGRNRTLGGAARGYSATEGAASGFGPGGITPPATCGFGQLDHGGRQSAACSAGIRGFALGRPYDDRPLAPHGGAGRVGAALYYRNAAPGIPSAVEHALAPRYDFTGAARSLPGARH